MLFGFLFSRFAPAAPERDWFRTSAFRHGLIFTTMFNTSALACYLVASDWMWMYFVPDGHTPPDALAYIFVFLYYVPYLAGFLLGVELRPRVPRIWFIGVAAMFAVNVALVVRLWDRYSVVGTTAEYFAGTAHKLFGETHSVSIIMNVYTVVMLAYVAVYWWRQRRVTTAPS